MQEIKYTGIYTSLNGEFPTYEMKYVHIIMTDDDFSQVVLLMLKSNFDTKRQKCILKNKTKLDIKFP